MSTVATFVQASSHSRHSAPLSNDEPHRAEDAFTRHPHELLEAALSKLSSAGVELIPWGSMLAKLLNVPRLLIHFEFLVPDEQLDAAHDIAAALHLPVTPPPTLLLETSGDLISKGRLYRLTRATELGIVQYLHLLPASFIGYIPSELVVQHHLSHTISIPRASAVYASILRLMASYPRSNSPVRATLGAELEMYFNHHLLGLPAGSLKCETDEEWAELEIDRRIIEAVCQIRTWGLNGEWRTGEEWMEDALVAIAKESGDIECLPWRSSTE